jgi:hypothetical protein
VDPLIFWQLLLLSPLLPLLSLISLNGKRSSERVAVVRR